MPRPPIASLWLPVALCCVQIANAQAVSPPTYDFNGDGTGDYIVSFFETTNAGSEMNGRVRVYSGVNKSLLVDLSSPDPNDLFGATYSTVGDIDGDGLDDLAVGAPGYSTNGDAEGRVYVYAGGSWNLLLTITGGVWESLGRNIASCGDVDGDGTKDLIASGYSPGTTIDPNHWTGAAWVFSGANGSVLREYVGIYGDLSFGSVMTDLGDIDGDGHREIAISSPYSIASSSFYGVIHLVMGIDDSYSGFESIDASELNTHLENLSGHSDSESMFGHSILPAKDFDGDGNREILVISKAYDDSWKKAWRFDLYNYADLGAVTPSGSATSYNIPQDVNGDLVVDMEDLVASVFAIGDVDDPYDPLTSDMDKDGDVDVFDLELVLDQIGYTSALKTVLESEEGDFYAASSSGEGPCGPQGVTRSPFGTYTITGVECDGMCCVIGINGLGTGPVFQKFCGGGGLGPGGGAGGHAVDVIGGGSGGDQPNDDDDDDSGGGPDPMPDDPECPENIELIIIECPETDLGGGESGPGVLFLSHDEGSVIIETIVAEVMADEPVGGGVYSWDYDFVKYEGRAIGQYSNREEQDPPVEPEVRWQNDAIPAGSSATLEIRAPGKITVEVAWTLGDCEASQECEFYILRPTVSTVRHLKSYAYIPTASVFPISHDKMNDAKKYPHINWRDFDLDGTPEVLSIHGPNEPLAPPNDSGGWAAAYKRGSRPQFFQASFLNHSPAYNNIIEDLIEFDKVRGFGPDGHIYEHTLDAGQRTNTQFINCTDILAFDENGQPAAHNSVLSMYDPYVVEWELDLVDGRTVSAGQTEFPLYVLHDVPDGDSEVRDLPTHRESLFNIACTKAAGQTTEDGIIDKIWEHFESLTVTDASGQTLAYYATGTFPGAGATCSSMRVYELLANGNAQCGAWASLFGAVLRSQKITDTQLFIIKPDVSVLPSVCGEGSAYMLEGDREMLIKNHQFITGGQTQTSGCTNYPYRFDHPHPVHAGNAWSPTGSAGCVDQLGVDGQSSTDPFSSFDLHFVIRVRSDLYDPSYGYTTAMGGNNWRLQYENHSLAGIAAKLLDSANNIRWGAKTNSPAAELDISPAVPGANDNTPDEAEKYY